MIKLKIMVKNADIVIETLHVLVNKNLLVLLTDTMLVKENMNLQKMEEKK